MPVPSRSSSEAHPSFSRIWLTHEQKAFQLGLAVVLLTLVVILSLFTSTFLTTGNILNILRQAAPTLIVAVAMTLVITSGGIDLSVGSSLALASVLAATMLSTGAMLLTSGDKSCRHRNELLITFATEMPAAIC